MIRQKKQEIEQNKSFEKLPENLQKQIRQAMRSKTMYFEMNQAGETPRSSPQPRNGAFFPHEANLSIAWKRGKPLRLPSRLPIPASLPTRRSIPAAPSAT